MTRQRLLFVGIGFFIVLSIAGVGYLLNTTTLTVNIKNTISYQVANGDRVIHSSTKNQSSIRVPKNNQYTIYFEGSKSYESSKRAVTVKDAPASISISPYYSKDRLGELLVNEKSDINSIVTAYDSIISTRYSIEDMKLYHYGDWASAKLVWSGEYGENTDTLTIILEKQNDVWAVVGSPSIVFFSGNNPEIPVDILRSVNSN